MNAFFNWDQTHVIFFWKFYLKDIFIILTIEVNDLISEKKNYA